MSNSMRSVGISVFIDSDSDMTVGDAESYAKKFIEIALRKSSVSWGPGISRELTSFGTRSVYLTLNPSFYVDVDSVIDVRCAIATVRLDDSQLLEQIFMEAYALEDGNQLSGILLVTGFSHPLHGHMTRRAGFYAHEIGMLVENRENGLETNSPAEDDLPPEMPEHPTLF